MGDTISIIFLIVMSAVYIIGGIVLQKAAEKDINETFGYRTERSVKNKETWKFANEYSGKLLIKCGIVSAVLALVLAVIRCNWLVCCVAEAAILAAVVAIVIIFTEKQLKMREKEDK